LQQINILMEHNLSNIKWISRKLWMDIYMIKDCIKKKNERQMIVYINNTQHKECSVKSRNKSIQQTSQKTWGKHNSTC
jgi:hypothetical protein